VADAHDEGEASVTFVHSGLSAYYYPRLGLKVGTRFHREAQGRKLSRKAVRKFLWEAFRGTSSPTSLPRTTVVWTTYDVKDDRSYVGTGSMSLRRGVSMRQGVILQEAV